MRATQPPTIELTIRSGPWRQNVRTVVLPVDELAWRDITQPVELSDRPLSLLLASPGVRGGYGDAVTIREGVFKLRRSSAQHIAATIVQALMKESGENDELDGYKISSMSFEEREFLAASGRLQPKRTAPLPPGPRTSRAEAMENAIAESLKPRAKDGRG